jgi:Ca2+-binding RTX toxin-like protein
MNLRIMATILGAAACLGVAIPVAAAAVIDGDDSPNVLLGTRRADLISAKGGNDFVNAFRGDDVVRGDAGDDVLIGGRGADLVFGGTENDLLIGGPGRDGLLGQAGNDVIIGGRRGDVVVGGSGDDRLMGDGGHDTLFAGIGSDVLVGGHGSDVLIARANDAQVDYLICGKGFDTAYARVEDRVHRSCERVIRVAGAETEPGDEETLPPAEATAVDGGEGGPWDGEWLDEEDEGNHVAVKGHGRDR